MKKKFISRILKQIMYRHLRAGYIRVGEGFKHTQHPFPNPFPYLIFSVYYIIEFDVPALATYQLL